MRISPKTAKNTLRHGWPNCRSRGQGCPVAQAKLMLERGESPAHTADNIVTPGGPSSLHRASGYNPGLRSADGRLSILSRQAFPRIEGRIGSQALRPTQDYDWKTCPSRGKAECDNASNASSPCIWFAVSKTWT
jgi:hypothetical protein